MRTAEYMESSSRCWTDPTVLTLRKNVSGSEMRKRAKVSNTRFFLSLVTTATGSASYSISFFVYVVSWSIKGSLKYIPGSDRVAFTLPSLRTTACSSARRI